MGRQPYQHIVMTRESTAASKELMVETLEEYSRQHGAQEVTRIIGRSMGATGAQRWAAAGIDLRVIQLFGRWEDARQMMKYVRDAALSDTCIDMIAKAKRREARSSNTRTTYSVMCKIGSSLSRSH